MLSKIEITGNIEVLTGMHIGASNAFAAIGAVDSPVARDTLSALPYIPGSSLKGKIRSLLAKAYSDGPTKRENEDQRIIRLFGIGKNKENKDRPSASRLIFTDAVLSNETELKKMGAALPTEIKEENTIDPVTAIANPRQIERAIRGSVFPLRIIYNVVNENELCDDIRILREGLSLLEYDYIGGHGSRGYGRVAIKDVNLDCVVGSLDEALLEKCRSIMKED